MVKKPKNKDFPPPPWARRLAACRELTNLSQAKFGEMVGVSQQSWAQYEQGKSEPSVQTWIRIAELTGNSVDAIMRGSMVSEANTRPKRLPPENGGLRLPLRNRAAK